MRTDDIVVAAAGGLLMIFIYWFFFGKKEGMVAGKRVDVLVDGGYKPQVIKIQKDQSVDITFLRRDENSCLEEVVFPDYRIKKYLPVGRSVQVTLNPPHLRVSEFHCGMNMYRGKVVVAYD